MEILKGVLVPNLTIFDSLGNVDIKRMYQHMEWMVNKGVNGFFLTGTYGSSNLLSLSEKAKIYELSSSIKTKYPHIQLVAQIGSPSTRDSLQCLEIAQNYGINKVASFAPLFYNYSKNDIYDYYKKVVQKSYSDVYIYNNPSLSKYKFDYDDIKTLQDIGIKGLKDSSNDIEFINSVYYDSIINNVDFDIVVGTSTGWIQYQKIGIKSMIAGMCNYAPEIIVKMYNASIGNDTKTAEKYYNIMMELNRTIKKHNSIAVSHAALEVRGFNDFFPREPIKGINHNDAIYNTIRNKFEKFNLTER